MTETIPTAETTAAETTRDDNRSFDEVLELIRSAAMNERSKGERFERLMQRWLLTDKLYADQLAEVWLWNEFPSRGDFGGKDLGIDLVARTSEGAYWAIQCKCYAEDHTISKPDVDSFLSTSSRSFADPLEGGELSCHFTRRLWISTTNHWNKHAEETIQNQQPPVTRIHLHDLQQSAVRWTELLEGKSGKEARQRGKQLLDHQTEAIEAAEAHFAHHERGQLIMACGTGKTFTSLRMMERLVQGTKDGSGLVLFLVPSIALLGQSLNDWYEDASVRLSAVCVCSDPQSAKRARKGAAAATDIYAGSLVDLAEPASTDVASVVRQLLRYRQREGLTVVFSTYQSIDVVRQAQEAVMSQTGSQWGEFDFIICDEAHRTTGAKLLGDKKLNDEESAFLRVHDPLYLLSKHRLYMTATPRLYGDQAKAKAQEGDILLCSMDDTERFGEEFYRMNFSSAVQQQLLCDYKVLVLTATEASLSETMRQLVRDGDISYLNYDNATRLIGIIHGLAKDIRGDNNVTYQSDPRPIRRALAFAPTIDGGSKAAKLMQAGEALNPHYAASSKGIAETFPQLSEHYLAQKRTAREELEALIPTLRGQAQEEAKTQLAELQEELSRLVHVDVRHVDGTMGAAERAEHLSWLASAPDDAQECRMLTNVRCLSEGVDVPALDAVLFLSARSSPVDIVQSVGRVMRTFRRGENPKKYGYIIIPIVVPEGVAPEDALTESTYEPVWEILNALRAHDDHFNALINSIHLNKKPSDKLIVATIPPATPAPADYVSQQGQAGIGGSDTSVDANEAQEATALTQSAVAQTIQFDEFRQQLYARLVERCGERRYWEHWARSVAGIAQRYIDRINHLVGQSDSAMAHLFAEFLGQLRENLNPAISEGEAIEMLAQHLITRPVFDALFEDYEFVKNNSISLSMQRMITELNRQAVDQENTELQTFYDSVRKNIGRIDNLEGKQTIIKDLYERFFKAAFSRLTDQLGIVYTPVPCVDFIIHSVEHILRTELQSALTEEGVHILDPFVGTGTFITRLLQSGLIAPEDLERKYRHEIHCNELALLAYYIADVNIESVYQQITSPERYVPYDGICLTDTFQLGEGGHSHLFKDTFFVENSQAIAQQKKSPIRIIITNPPYSIGQKSANDNAQNLKYERLDQRVASTYVARSSATLNRGLYDSYIRAFRWGTDRILYRTDEQGDMHPNEAGELPERGEGGILAFISNGSWIDSNSHDGFRATLRSEYDRIYIVNLRGNQRTQGELSRREGGKIFGQGSRTPIAITILVKYPAGSPLCRESAEISYYEVGDYLKTQEKLDILTHAHSIAGLPFRTIEPNDKEDWINLRDDAFDSLIPINPEKKFDSKSQSLFTIYSLGIVTNRDGWAYNYSSEVAKATAERSIDCYNRMRMEIEQGLRTEPDFNSPDVSWSRSLKNQLSKGKILDSSAGFPWIASYRPFCKQQLFWYPPLIEVTYRIPSFFPTPQHKNLCICVNGAGGSKDFTCLITDKIPDIQFALNGQCFPLYWYSEVSGIGKTDLFGKEAEEHWERHDGVSDWILSEVRKRYTETKNLGKEEIFYYVYGLLHHRAYRSRFAADLRKGLPRLPLVERASDFRAISGVGRELAQLHLHYEDYPHLAGVEVLDTCDEELEGEEAYRHYAVEKIQIDKHEGDRPGTLRLNSRITITGIPPTAYNYQVNGRSALHWVIDRYQRRQDPKSGIVNDPNAWAREVGNPRYILDLILSLIHVATETERLIDTLPELSL